MRAVATSTRARILDAAMLAFATRGYEATALDALAAGLGVSKQTVLHHFGSKDRLFAAVLERSGAELAAAFDEGLSTPGSGWERVEAVVRATFTLAGRRPELLGFAREATRLGGPYVTALAAATAPLVERATAFLRAEMAVGALRTTDARIVVLSAYSTVIGAATEVEVLRSLGLAPGPRVLARRRRDLLAELRAQLLPGAGIADDAESEAS